MSTLLDQHLHRAGAEEQVIKVALELILTTGYASESPDTDAYAAYASDELALAARRLVQAVDRLPREDQPTGWQEAGTQ